MAAAGEKFMLCDCVVDGWKEKPMPEKEDKGQPHFVATFSHER